MKLRSDDIALVEGNNELNVQLTPVAKAKFYMPPTMEVKVTNGSLIDIYWWCEFSVTITNKGNATGIHTLTGRDNLAPAWDGPRPWGPSQITLAPGESYTWSVSYYIDFHRVSAPYVWELWGDWEQDNYSKGEARP